MKFSQADLMRLARADYTRRVMITDNLQPYQAEDIVGKLLELDAASDRPIVVGFNTNGGSHKSAEFIAIGNLRLLRSPTVGIAYGHCFSAGFTILQACKYRYAVPTARFLVHNVSQGLRFRPDQDPELAAQTAKQLVYDLREDRKRIIEILRKRLHHLSQSEFIDMMNEDRIIEVPEALKLRFLDGVIDFPD